MITHLSGNLFDVLDDALVLDVRGVGYHVLVSEKTRQWAENQHQLDLWIFTVVREQAFELYGFEHRDERYFFEKLIGVSGVGPKSGLAIIGLASTDTLYRAIVNEQIEFLSSVPGIGKKTAERICIELRDKLEDYQGNTEPVVEKEDQDVIDALLALGYSRGQAHQAITQIASEKENEDPALQTKKPSTQDRIKEALSYLSQ